MENDKITKVVDKYIKLMYKKFPETRELGKPTVEYTRVGRTAGKCKIFRQSLTCKLVFHKPLLEEHSDQIEQVIVHELSHYVAFMLDRNSSPHGQIWKKVMREFGFFPDIYHDMDTRKYAIVQKRYVYNCGCMEHHLSGKKHKTAIHGMYKCKSCNNKLEFTGKTK